MRIKVPAAFQISPFVNEELIYDETSIEYTIQNGYFTYDILKGQDIPAYEPWLDVDYAIPLVLESWKSNKPSISRLFKERKRDEAQPLMVHYTAHYLSSLYWLNGLYVRTPQLAISNLNMLSSKPVNIEERFVFIINRPGHYHAFIQLIQLYEELEKLFAAMMIKKKRPSK
ncbi:GTPase [Ectobacillus sp. JY-23]|uniref:YpoC family protein n=1 Tax=Ectobacillus sp. JY-23 TaxID=2933872 RepID=UPI001FF640EB|nr:GTPase [Ectobacillus sp. JY-23]UOY93437.1 GTPase [Ectobacillus sp. JY-23]